MHSIIKDDLDEQLFFALILLVFMTMIKHFDGFVFQGVNYR